MSSRLVIGGRPVIVTGRAKPVQWSRLLPRDREGRPVDAATAVQPLPAKSEVAPGLTLVDREEGVTYRCLQRLDPEDGWATTSFWQARWKCTHAAVLAAAMAGYLDAAVEVGSQVRRYRCRDERGLLDSSLLTRFRARAERARGVPRSAGKWRPR